MIYSVVLVSAVAIHVHISPLFWISFSFRFIFIHLVLNFNSYLKVGHNSFLQYGRFSPFYNPVIKAWAKQILIAKILTSKFYDGHF